MSDPNQPLLPAVVEQETEATRQLLLDMEYARPDARVPKMVDLKSALVRRAMRLSPSKAAAARALGVDRRTLARLLKREAKAQ